MSINLFSLETLSGLIIGLLHAFFIRNIFKKKEDLGDYSTNLQTLTNKIQEFQDENAEDRGEMKANLAAAKAIADSVPEDHISSEYIIPSIFDKAVTRIVAREVA